MAKFEVTFPKPGKDKDNPQHVSVTKLRNNKHVLVVDGLMGAETEDWEDEEPAYAHLYVADPDKATARGHVLRLPGQDEDRSFAISFVIPKDVDISAKFHVRIFNHKKKLVQEISYLTFIAVRAVDRKVQESLMEAFKDIQLVQKLIDVLTQRGFLHFANVSPSTPLGAVPAASFIVSGGFSSPDTTVMRVELWQGAGTSPVKINNNPFCSPMGYFAASFSTVPAAKDYYYVAVGNANSGRSGTFEVK